MQKSEKLENSLGVNDKTSIRDKMMAGDVSLIEKNIASNNNLGCILAIAAAVKNQIKTDVVVCSLKRLKNKNEFEFCMNVSELSLAALHMLGIENYSGDNKNVKKLIDNKFSFVI